MAGRTQYGGRTPPYRAYGPGARTSLRRCAGGLHPPRYLYDRPYHARGFGSRCQNQRLADQFPPHPLPCIIPHMHMHTQHTHFWHGMLPFLFSLCHLLPSPTYHRTCRHDAATPQPRFTTTYLGQNALACFACSHPPNYLMLSFSTKRTCLPRLCAASFLACRLNNVSTPSTTLCRQHASRHGIHYATYRAAGLLHAPPRCGLWALPLVEPPHTAFRFV